MKCKFCSNREEILESTLYCADGVRGGDSIPYCNAFKREIGYLKFAGFEFEGCNKFEPKE